MRFSVRAATLLGTVLALSAAAAPALRAQEEAPLVNGDTSVFRRLDLPAPNQYRSASGMPGPQYWQQKVDYAIQAKLDTAQTSLSGDETVTYTNNSPDTLRWIWFQLDQNIYRPESLGSDLNPENARFAGGGFQGGMTLSYVKSGGQTLKPYVNDTRMRVDLPEPLAPGASTTVQIGWSFPVPEHGSDRMARQGSLYEMAQWYPRVFVYDDVHGWNTDPYLGQGEFYLEYGSFDVALTVPSGYVIAATGTLQNPDEVLTSTERQRLAKAEKSTTQVQIIGPDEVGKPSTRPSMSGTMTWKFHADSVHDFAWAGSPNFRWDAMASASGVRCSAFYQPKDTSWTTAADMTCFSIDEFSNRWYPYPWPHATSVAGPVGGMEYPMIVFVSGRGGEHGTFTTIAHEHGHEWFPMLVGSNERRFAWMDEGFNTFIDTWANDRRYPGSNTRESYLRAYYRGASMGMDQPLMTPPDRINPAGLGLVGYRKPGIVLHLLRDQVLGPDTFDKAFQEYIRRWAFKHPTPADFFRTMEDVSGQDLSWFFREWFYSTDRLDQAIAGVDQKQLPSGDWQATVHLVSKDRAVMPVDLTLSMANGQSRTVDLPVQIWYRGSAYAYTTTLPSKLTAATIDANRMVPDANREDNTWSAVAADGQQKP